MMFEGLLSRRVKRPPRARSVAAGVVILCATAALATAPAAADTVDDKKAVDAQIDELEAALEDTSAELAKAYQALTQTQAQLPAARARLSSAQSAADAAARENSRVAAELALAQANAARAAESVQRNEQTREQTQRTLDAFAADMFQGGSVGQLSVALGATSADDFATRLVMADTVTSMTNQALSDLAAAKADADADRAYLSAVEAEVIQLKKQAEAALVAADKAKSEAQTAKSALDGLVAQQSAYAGQVADRKASEEAQLAAAEAEQKRLQDLLIEQARIAREQEAARKAAEEAARKAAEEAAKRDGKPIPPRPSPTPPPLSSSGFLTLPVSGGRFSSEFGMRFHPILRYYKLHTGLDIAGPCGTPVRAAADGRVFRAGWRGAYGNSILIDHGIIRGVDLVTTYNHLTSIVVSGGSVSRGQLIGYSGTTGWSTGCHLHFETLEDGSFVNPRNWL